MGKFLTKFSDKILLDVKISKDQTVSVKKGIEKYVYISYKLFFEDLREYYINRINNMNVIAKKAICFDATQAFYVYQDLFGIYCDRVELLNEIEFHTKYFQNQFEVLKRSDEENMVSHDTTYPTIFKNNAYLKKFVEILEGLNAFDSNGNPIKRGFMAKANSIFTYDKGLDVNSFEKKILLPNISVKEFVNFLNLEFKLGIKYHSSYKLSSGEKHEKIVKRFY